MHNINPVPPVTAPKTVDPTAAVAGGKPAAAPAQICDTVEISTVAKLAAKVQDIPDIRADLVARVKEQIAAGTYETPQRIEAAVDKLMEDLLGSS